MIRTLAAVAALLAVIGGILLGLSVSANADPVGGLVPHTAAEVEACFTYAEALDGEGGYSVCTTDAAAYEAWKVEYYRAR